MPSNTVPYLAPGPGHIWFAGKTSQGWTVKIDHHGWAGFPLITYHTHMSQLFIDEWDDGKGGLYVPAGFELGFIGNTPKSEDDINHVHFEMWDYTKGVPPGRENRALDPEPYLKCFGHRVLPA
jgi:murein DD-endopeptidase MepM/ murein hydrolase activator NlpD